MYFKLDEWRLCMEDQTKDKHLHGDDNNIFALF